MDKSKIKPEVREQVVNMMLIAKEVISQYFKYDCPDNVAEDIAYEFLKAGYGKVEYYKKEIERLKGIIAMTEQHFDADNPFEDAFIGLAEGVSD